MIESVLEESVWLAYLTDAPPFTVGEGPVYVVSPHPDDETLAAGGLIADCSRRGLKVSVIAVTDGEKAYEDYPDLAETRRHEQLEAIRELGVEESRLIRLGLPDSGVATCTARLAEIFVGLIEPTSHIIAPWPGDFHPDHEACGRAAWEASCRLGTRLSWWFFWTWHTKMPNALEDLELQKLALDDDLLSRKRRALAHYRSQLENDASEPILPTQLLVPANRPFEVFAAT